ncbi:MAG: hypothetical protein WB975_07565 [Nitrososphaeraceae archaeon]
MYVDVKINVIKVMERTVLHEENLSLAKAAGEKRNGDPSGIFNQPK